MKQLRFLITFLSLVCLSTALSAQTKTSDMWSALLDKPGLATYFDGIFKNLGLVIEETEESFTVVHKGDRFEIVDGINPETVDYIVPIRMQNMANMQKHGSDGKIGPYESYRIMSVLFTPLTRASLQHPMFRKKFQQKLVGIENHVHVTLKSPTNDEATSHTLIFQNKTWFVVPGLHGEAKRSFEITPEQAIEYQRQVFKAQNTNKKSELNKFKKWYLQWRKSVSVVV